MRVGELISSYNRPMKIKPAPFLLFAAILSVATWLNWKGTLPAPRFAVALPRPLATASIPPAVAMIPKPATTPSAHSASLIALPDGDRLAFWFGGSREGATDVRIWMARQHAGQWQMPKAVVGPESLGRDTGRFVKKVGNPLVYRTPDGVLHLFVVSVSFGGWAGSSLNYLQSQDNGINWGPAQKLVTSPFFNLSTLVRTHAVALKDGGFYLPAYHELVRKYPMALRFDREGHFVGAVRIGSQNQTLQPAMVAVTEAQAFTYLRNAGKERKVLMQETLDGGLSWSAPRAINLPNPDAAIAVDRLPDGRLLMAYNPLTEKRFRLALATSVDGVLWVPLQDVESDQPAAEFSYPSLQVNGDQIDLAYTWNRQQIRYRAIPAGALIQRPVAAAGEGKP